MLLYLKLVVPVANFHVVGKRRHLHFINSLFAYDYLIEDKPYSHLFAHVHIYSKDNNNNNIWLGRFNLLLHHPLHLLYILLLPEKG